MNDLITALSFGAVVVLLFLILILHSYVQDLAAVVDKCRREITSLRKEVEALRHRR